MGFDKDLEDLALVLTCHQEGRPLCSTYLSLESPLCPFQVSEAKQFHSRWLRIDSWKQWCHQMYLDYLKVSTEKEIE